MPILDFDLAVPYRSWTSGTVDRPMLRVIIHHRSQSAPPMLAIVDSGADVSLFHVDVAIRAGIDLSQCQIGGTQGIGGVATSHNCPVELEILGRRFPADVRFTDMVPPRTALLGRNDVFEQFQFGFDQRGRRLYVKPYP